MVTNETTTFYNFTYGFVRGMQANNMFQGACQSQIDTLTASLSVTAQEALTAFLPKNWFNFLDRLRVDLNYYAALQQQCQFYNLLEILKGLFTLEGLFSLVSRLVPQSFFLKTQFETIMKFLGENDYYEAGKEIGNLVKNILGQPVN